MGHIVERQLTRRFGPLGGATRERLKNATLEQLDCWAENILDAATLEGVFVPPQNRVPYFIPNLTPASLVLPFGISTLWRRPAGADFSFRERAE